MKQFLIFSTLLLFLGCSEREAPKKNVLNKDKTTTQKESPKPVANRVKSIWSEVTSDLYETLPQNEVSYSKLFDGARDLIFENAQRTLSEHADIIAPFDKLAHPNGVCIRGLWEINNSNIYSGYF